jgi:hypothetical protein
MRAITIRVTASRCILTYWMVHFICIHNHHFFLVNAYSLPCRISRSSTTSLSTLGKEHLNHDRVSSKLHLSSISKWGEDYDPCTSCGNLQRKKVMSRLMPSILRSKRDFKVSESVCLFVSFATNCSVFDFLILK